jgi:hypothetical protein
MSTKTLSMIALLCISVNATVFTCINQSGLEIGAGNSMVDFVLKGNFCYLSMDNDYRAYRIIVSPNIECRLVTVPHFKLYGMSGIFADYGNFYPGYANAEGASITRQEILYGINVLVLRPEVTLFPKIALYANLPIVKVEAGSEVGNTIWIFSLISSSSLENQDAIPEIGIKYYF